MMHFECAVEANVKQRSKASGTLAASWAPYRVRSI